MDDKYFDDQDDFYFPDEPQDPLDPYHVLEYDCYDPYDAWEEEYKFFIEATIAGEVWDEWSQEWVIFDREIPLEATSGYFSVRRFHELELLSGASGAQERAVHWLARRLGCDELYLLEFLAEIRTFGGTARLYETRIRKNKHGKRLVQVPGPRLKALQKRIHKAFVPRRLGESCLMRLHRRRESFGCIGGGVKDALWPHARTPRAFFLADMKKAFFQITYGKVFAALHSPGNDRLFLPKFGWYAAQMLASLCLYFPVAPDDEARRMTGCGDSFLPVGSPTSPALFDLCCAKLDSVLRRLCDRYGARYTRYMDNFIFSVNSEEFPPALARAIVCEARGRGFKLHKFRRVKRGRCVRSLGLNIEDGVLKNTKVFKNDFRGALHRLAYVLRKQLPYKKLASKVAGMLGGAVPENFPPKYLAEAARLLAEVKERRREEIQEEELLDKQMFDIESAWDEFLKSHSQE